jgi:amino acid adenylation domain-containing protein
MPQTGNLCDYLARSAASVPDHPAVVDPTGRQLTYRQLDELSDRIAGYLVALGVAPGDRVGVIAPKSASVVATLFGVMKAGGAYVPADYSAPASRNQTLLNDCAVKAVFLHSECAGIARDWPGAKLPGVIWFDAAHQDAVPDGVGAPWTTVEAHEPLALRRLADSNGLAYILYTSGSTGVPKGVVLTHANATSFVDWCSDEFAPTGEDRFSSHAPFHFDLSVLDLYLSLKHGATLYLVSEGVGKSPQELAAFISDNRLTVWYSTPSILSLLAQFGSLEKRDCSSVRIVFFAGEVFPVKHLRNIVDLWPQATFFNLYGPTETNVCTFARIPRTIPADRTEPYPIGFVCPHCEAMVLDAPSGAEVPRGEEGLLHIAGESLFQGYWKKTDGLFFERNGRRWYNTGDVVCETPDVGFVYRGRLDRMVKRRGYRIELAEIERGLYQNERIREAAAIAVPDPAAGVRIVAYLTAHEGARPSIIELKAFCNRSLPSYMSPDVFVYMDALPRTSTDKIDYQSLTRTAQAQQRAQA